MFVKHTQFESQEFKDVIFTDKKEEEEISRWIGELEKAFKDWGYMQK